MSETQPMIISKPYDCMGNAECWVIVSRGALGFRFGPFSGPKAGEILSQCLDEHIPAFLTMNCGPEFDWTMARDLRGEPQPEASHEGTS